MNNLGFHFNLRQQGKAPVRKNPPFQPTQGDFNKLFDLSTKNSELGIRRNKNYMRNDYYQNVLLPKHPDWKRTYNRDLDGDGLNDIVIHDQNNNIKYFNGYSLYKVPKREYDYQDYLTNDKRDKTKGESINSYRETKNPTKFILNKSVSLINKLVNEKLKTFPNGQELINQKDEYKFKDKLKSILKRYVLLPYAYTVLGYNTEEIKTLPTLTLKGKTITDLKQAILTLYGKKGVRKIINDGGYTILSMIINNVKSGMINEIKNNVISFVEGVINGNTQNLNEALFDNAVSIGEQARNKISMQEEEIEEELE